MKIKDLRELKKEDLAERLSKNETELKDFVFDFKIGKEKDYSKKNKLKKEIARIKTLLKEVK